MANFLLLTKLEIIPNNGTLNLQAKVNQQTTPPLLSKMQKQKQTRICPLICNNNDTNNRRGYE